MRLATNQLGFAVHRLDGPIGWVAITETRDSRGQAVLDLETLDKTPGAEYRVEPVLKQRS